MRRPQASGRAVSSDLLMRAVHAFLTPYPTGSSRAGSLSGYREGSRGSGDATAAAGCRRTRGPDSAAHDAIHPRKKLRHRERLRQEADGSFLDRALRLLVMAESRTEKDTDVPVHAEEAPVGLEAAQARHHHVEEDQIDPAPVLAVHLERLDPVPGEDHFVAAQAQDVA